MKKLLLIFLIYFSQYNIAFSQCYDENGDFTNCPPDPGEDPNDPNAGLGKSVPIDDYLPALVVLGITLGGVVVYKNRKRLS